MFHVCWQPICVGGIQLSEVWSPSRISSSNQRAMSLRSSCFSIVLRLNHGSIDLDNLSGDVRTEFGREEESHISHLFRFTTTV